MQALLTEGRLKSHPFMGGASKEFLNQVEEFATDGSIDAGVQLFREGEYADRCYLIVSGSVALEMECDSQRNALIEVVHAGGVVGWSWLFPPFEWHLSARTLEPCEVVILNGASLLIRAEEDPKFGFELIRRITREVIHRLQSTRCRLACELKKARDAK
jgi:CRP-like cAMP-binding protein